MARIATNRAISQQRKAHWLETHNGIRDRLRPLAYEIFSYGWSKVQPDWKGILQNRKKDLIKPVRTEPDLWEEDKRDGQCGICFPEPLHHRSGTRAVPGHG